jgi:hypothetical protein
MSDRKNHRRCPNALRLVLCGMLIAQGGQMYAFNAGVNFNNYSRDALMRKLARTDEPADSADQKQKMAKPKTETKPLPVSVSQASRCVLLRNMFDPTE